MTTKCYKCNNQLTGQEVKWNIENAEYCCNGSNCGCRGLPISPPFCFTCTIEIQSEYIEGLKFQNNEVWEMLCESKKDELLEALLNEV